MIHMQVLRCFGALAAFVIPCLGVLFLLACVALILLADEERLEEISERRAVNVLADQSRKRKAPGMRKQSRYIRAGIQK